MDFGLVSVLLLQVKYAPETIDDAEWLRLTEQQIRADQNSYRHLGTYQTNLDSLIALGRTGNQLEQAQKQVDSVKSGIVFDREDVEVANLQFVTRDLMPTFREHLVQMAAKLPDRYAIEFTRAVLDYEYDFDAGALVWPRNSWACGLMTGQNNPIDGNCSHFFLNQPNLGRGGVDSIPGTEGHFFLRPERPQVTGSFDMNPYGFPTTLANAGRRLLGLDRDIAMPSLAMDAGAARALLEGATTQVRGRGGTMRTAPDGSQTIVSVVHFRTVDARFSPEPVVAAELERIEIIGPDGELIRAFGPGDFPAAKQ